MKQSELKQIIREEIQKLTEVKFSTKHRASEIIQYAMKNWSYGDDIEAVFDGEYGQALKKSLLQVKNDKEFWEWVDKNFDE